MDRNRPTGILIPILLLAASGGASAVEVFPEQRPAGLAQQSEQVAQRATAQELTKAVGRLPETSATSVELTGTDQEKIARDNENAPADKPLKIGAIKPANVKIDLQSLDVGAMTNQTYSYQSGLVREEGGRVALAVRLDALNAAGERLFFDEVNLPKNARIYITNEANEVFGPYSGDHPSFWTQTITGEHIYVHVDVTDADSDSSSFRVASVLLFDGSSQAFCAVNAPCVEDGSCHRPAEWPQMDNVRKAIAHINFIEDDAAYICSGGLLADTDPTTAIPYFLTADHCVNSPEVAATVETWFNYMTPSCNGGCPAIQPGTSSTVGAALLHHSAVDDHSLLVLDQAPPAGAWFLGWSSTPVATVDGTPLFRLSHPQGSPQAFSAQRVDTSFNPADDYCETKSMPRGRFIFSRNLMGATEGGSSGAPVLTGNGQVVGQLFGICGYNTSDVCDFTSNTTVDGAFANYYNDVAKWLNPDPLQVPLTVEKLGTGEGRVASSMADNPSTVAATAQTSAAVSPMLLGGTAIERTDWPWEAALEISTWGLNGKWNCGGSVIDQNWILTAAHCVVDNVDARHATISPANVKVRTGSSHFYYGGQESKVKRIVKHPDFDPVTFDHDIALLELTSPVYVDPIRPVTWAREPKLACLGTLGDVTGWTDTTVCGLPATVLSKVGATIIDPAKCRTAYDADNIASDLLCTSSTAENKDCQLDGGSPLVVENGRGGYVQAGIVSNGNGCASPKLPTVHTRLASHVAWMESTTGLDLSSAVGDGVIDCGSNCNAQFGKNAVVTLIATATPGSTFKGWGGACAGAESSCQVTMTQAQNVKATFSGVQLSTSCASTTP